MGRPAITQAPETAAAELEACVRSAQSGDTEAFSQLIDLTQARLLRFFKHLAPSPQLAEDLCQDTYIRAFENLRKLKNPENFMGWLFRTGKNIFLDHVKLHKNSKTLSVEVPPELGGAAHPDVDLDVRRAMEGLEAEDRLVLVLIHSEAHSYQEAAEIMGISEAAVRSRVHRARKAFMENYQRR